MYIFAVVIRSFSGVFCNVSHFLFSFLSPGVSAVVSVHCNIIKWWHKVVFPFFSFQSSEQDPVLYRRDLIVERVLEAVGHFGDSICGDTIEMLEPGALFGFSGCRHPCPATKVVCCYFIIPDPWEQDVNRVGRRHVEEGKPRRRAGADASALGLMCL